MQRDELHELEKKKFADGISLEDYAKAKHLYKIY